jgi:hypothetical protein
LRIRERQAIVRRITGLQQGSADGQARDDGENAKHCAHLWFLEAIGERVPDITGLAVGGSLLEAGDAPDDRLTLSDAQHAFYNARYDVAAAQTLDLRTADPEDLAAHELRASALHFQLKNALGASRDKQKAFKGCEPCAAWVEAFLADTKRGQAVARRRLAVDAADEGALFFLGKLDLNYVWLQLGTLGRKTGWDEYWEARRSLDAVLKANPQHVRARVARAWIDYIVDTRMPRGTRWMLGGGSRKRALVALREAANTEAEFYIRAEAEFSLWDIQVRERNLSEAAHLARKLLRDFPDNRDLVALLATDEVSGARD